MQKPILAVTMGDVAGVGPELCAKLLSEWDEDTPFVPVCLGDAAVFHEICNRLKITNQPQIHSIDNFESRVTRPVLVDFGLIDMDLFEPGKVQGQCGFAAGTYIQKAVTGVQSGLFDAILTAPINKEALHLGGFDYPGHTEFLADLSGAPGKEAMMLYSPQIAVVFATLHTSLENACKSLSKEAILKVTHLADQTIRKIRGRSPRLGMLALNPHAGEAGLFGDAESKIIMPVIENLQKEGIDVTGPLVPDAAFVASKRANFDCYITMYHDQGSIPFKMLAFDEGVNVTMGLPITRTSPDHGTAFDIAWQGLAKTQSFEHAALLAARLVSHRIDRN